MKRPVIDAPNTIKWDKIHHQTCRIFKQIGP
jgi:hypothetical protein